MNRLAVGLVECEHMVHYVEFVRLVEHESSRKRIEWPLVEWWSIQLNVPCSEFLFFKICFLVSEFESDPNQTNPDEQSD